MNDNERFKPIMLQGLSEGDRKLMLAMMAALGSAGQTMMLSSLKLANTAVALDSKQVDLKVDASNMVEKLDAEANAIIDLIKACKERLTSGRAVVFDSKPPGGGGKLDG